jgi:hypothetical protein
MGMRTPASQPVSAVAKTARGSATGTCLALAECARPRAQQAPPPSTRWIFTDTPLALHAAAPEDRRATLNRSATRNAYAR